MPHGICLDSPCCIKAMDDSGVVITPFGDVVTVSLLANTYVQCANLKRFRLESYKDMVRFFQDLGVETF